MSGRLPVPGQSDPAKAETYLRLVAEAELRQRPVISGPGPHPHRVWVTAATLVAAGVIHPDVAWQVVSEFEISAGLRSGNARPVISTLHRPHWVGQSGVSQHEVSQHGASQPGASHQLPGVVVGHGHRGRTRLVGLPSRPGSGPAAGHQLAGDRTGRPGPAGADRPGRATRGGADRDRAGSAGQRRGPAAGPGGRRPLLGLEASEPRASGQLEARIAQVIQDLIGSGALRADDPAVLRLAGLGWRLGLDLGLGGPVPARAMPPAWISVLAHAHAHDGPDAVASFAADLPEIGGSRFALAGLRSARSGATLHVMATGWEPHGQGWLVHGTGPSGEPLDPSLSWRARDSTGRWHLVSGMSWGMATQTRGMIKIYLTPPPHPEATSLDVILSGPGCRVQATVPLDWGSGQ